MKTLVLVRHAKSSWSDPSLEDKDRPLNERGKRDAPAMGKRLADAGVKPDLILSSSARRARKTARILAKALGCDFEDIRLDDGLYAVGAEDLLAALRRLGDKPGCVMLVGHNPELTELAHGLSSRIAAMPTCAVAVFEFDARSWPEAVRQAPASVTFYAPKEP
ncbi:MAG: histidine phosphatase family protein [Betaproteobacteria bacterium]|nr:histidine phosphatase family protein [Betaproteobacteria bacterium]